MTCTLHGPEGELIFEAKRLGRALFYVDRRVLLQRLGLEEFATKRAGRTEVRTASVHCVKLTKVRFADDI